MKCSKHTSEDAVAYCDKCGAGLCQHCFNASEYVVNEKHLCRSCNLQLMNDMLAVTKKDAVKNLVKVIFFGACVVIGIVAWRSTPGFNGVCNYFFIAGIGCLPTTWRMTANSAKENAVEALHEACGDYSFTFMGLIIRILVAFLFGGIGAPFVLLFGIIKFIKARMSVTRLEKEIASFQA